PGVEFRGSLRGHADMIVMFVKRRADFERRIGAAGRSIFPGGGLWIAWPKRTSGVATDLSENPVRELGLGNGLVDNKVAAIDETWSGLRFVYRVKDRPRDT
ncbi:MAG: DUF3052 domain-containing protein, partial [Acidimicrobiia bacterium]|nr:DUF3052 domain-containing protein [Acidimicrobiia bacterium]